MNDSRKAVSFKVSYRVKGVRYLSFSVCNNVSINKYNEIADKETKYQKTT